jgi:hypothetical protein
MQIKERIDFNAITAILVKIQSSLSHLVLDEDAFKGVEYTQQIELMSQINKAATDQKIPKKCCYQQIPTGI